MRHSASIVYSKSRICMVCTGNVCRSPMAEGFARELCRLNGLPFTVTSAGVYADNGGRVSTKAAVACRELDIDISGHMSRDISKINFDSGDTLFVCMTADHANYLSREYPGLAESCLAVLGGGIEDPFGGTLEEYTNCLYEIAGDMTALLGKLADGADVDNRPAIRPARPADAWALTALERECFSAPWSARAFLEGMASGHMEMLVCVSGGKAAGYIGMQTTRDTGYITNICVTESRRREGLGGLLLSAMLERAAALGEHEITLEVRESNAIAMNLYEKHGFKRAGVRPKFYDHPPENGIMMTREMDR